MLSIEDELVYYGTPNVSLCPVTGIFKKYSLDCIKQDPITPESAEETLKYLKDLSYLNKNYADYYIPCVPETPIYLDCSAPGTETGSDFVSTPLLKVKIKEEEKSNAYYGIMSGHRSAILQGKSGTFYRLKGCGNDLEGFPVIDGKGCFVEHLLRGAQFKPTAARELYYSQYIHDILKPYNIPCANLPIGLWKYDKDLKGTSEVKTEEFKNDVPELDKYCSVFSTLGERRLGSHLLNGFELLIKAIIEVAIRDLGADEKTLELILALYPSNRKEDNYKTWTLISNHSQPIVNGIELTLTEWCKKSIFTEEMYKKLVSNKELLEKLDKDGLNKIKEASNKIEEWAKIFMESVPKDKQLLGSKIINNLAISCKKSGKSILEHLIDIYARIGYETSLVKRALQDQNINWGTFIDHGPFNFHCNAHANNFVILPPGNDSLLAPLDFDFAHCRKNFICIVDEAETYGQHDESFFDNYSATEIFELAKGLTGNKNNYFFSDEEEEKVIAFEDKMKDAIRFLLCDTLLEVYMRTFDKEKCPHVIVNVTKNETIHDLIKIALIKTYEEIA